MARAEAEGEGLGTVLEGGVTEEATAPCRGDCERCEMLAVCRLCNVEDEDE